jgi:hypothetical protein
MIIKDVDFNGTTYLCQLTLDENRRINAGQTVNIPANRRVVKRPGIARAAQVKAAGFAAPPVIFF